MITQEQIVKEFKKLFPSAVESDSKVTVTINGVKMEFNKNTSSSKIGKSQSIRTSVFR